MPLQAFRQLNLFVQSSSPPCAVTPCACPNLKKAAERIAAADDTTMTQFFVVTIAEKSSSMETADFFQKRAALGNPQTAQSAWDKVGASAALPEDQWAQIADDPSR